MSNICICFDIKGKTLQAKKKKKSWCWPGPAHSLLSCLQHLSGSCLTTRNSDFTTATVMDEKSEPPPGIWRFLISQTEKRKQVGGGGWVRDEAKSKEMLHCQGILKKKKNPKKQHLHLGWSAAGRLAAVPYVLFNFSLQECQSPPQYQAPRFEDTKWDNVRSICCEVAERQTCLPWLAAATSRLGFPRSY